MRIPRLERIPRPGGKRSRRYKKADPIKGSTTVDLTDPAVREVHARLGRRPSDFKLAKRVVTLMRKHPNGTVPELVAMDWLDQQKIEYIYLAQIFGGHARRGGVEVDLLFEYAGQGIALMVHGNYWHNLPDVAASDIIDKLRFTGATYHGIQIDKVVVCWENRIYHDRPQIFELAVLGIEMGEG